MTARGPDDAKDLRDPRFDAAWRAYSREEPPAALDDAIRAAARREARAGPRPVDTAAPHILSALRPQRWWWPLAAAATIGAVAIGLLQLATPDRVGGAATDRSVVSDIPVVPEQARRRAEAAREELPSGGGAQAPERAADASLTSPAPPSAEPAAAGSAQSSAMPRSPAASAPRKDAVAPIMRNERTPTPPTFAAEPPPAAGPSPEKPSSAAEKKTPQAGVGGTAAAAEPFPSDAAKRDAKEAASSAPTLSKTAPTTGTGALASGLAGAPAPATPAEQAQTRDSAAAAPPAAGNVTSPPAPTAPSSAPGHQASTRAAPQLATTPVAQSSAARAELRAKQHPALPVAEWIALIRRLRDEGRPEDATKELAAFRAAYADHQRRLPPDLRDWHPPAR